MSSSRVHRAVKMLVDPTEPVAHSRKRHLFLTEVFHDVEHEEALGLIEQSNSKPSIIDRLEHLYCERGVVRHEAKRPQVSPHKRDQFFRTQPVWRLFERLELLPKEVEAVPPSPIGTARAIWKTSLIVAHRLDYLSEIVGVHATEFQPCKALMINEVEPKPLAKWSVTEMVEQRQC